MLFSRRSSPWRGFLGGGVARFQAGYPTGAGGELPQKFVTAGRRTLEAPGVPPRARRPYSTRTEDLEALAPGRSTGHCTQVARERTGVFGQPLDTIREGHFERFGVHAPALQRRPGRTTDRTDAEWLAMLLPQGWRPRRFIPDRLQSE